VLLEAFLDAFRIDTLFWLSVGTVIGIIIGALPGLTATMGIALMIPLSYRLDFSPAIGLLIGVYFGAVIGASIPAVLFGIPGNPNAIATVYDGYEMTKKGEAPRALGAAIGASFCGGILSFVLLVLLAPQIARVALMFGPPEYFALGVFGLTMLGSLSGKSILRGLISALIGVAISMVGMDPISGVRRFTFGMKELLDGIPLIPVLIGIYGFGQVFWDIDSLARLKLSAEAKKLSFRLVLRSIFDVGKYLRTIVESSLIGAGVGAFPGTGASIAVLLAYSRAKSRNPNMGSGDVEGVIAPETANNAVTGGAMIPTLSLGIPGDSATALLMSALILKGIRPGPLLFRYELDVVYKLFIILLLANIVMVLFMTVGIRFFVKLLSIPAHYLIPWILVTSTLGAFAVNERYFDVILAFIFGAVGYAFRKHDFPQAPLVLGMIIGPIIESEVRRSLIMFKGNWGMMFSRPIVITFFAITIVSLTMSAVRRRKKGS
jgi:putative tricarboxylic transport membrane protein